MLELLDAAMTGLPVNGQGAPQGRPRRGNRLSGVAAQRQLHLLGMREYVYSGEGDSATVERGKGAVSASSRIPMFWFLRQGKDAVTTTPEILQFLQGPDLLNVTKANVKSVVHRRAYMDYVGVKRFDANGKVTGELRIVGLFAATAYSHSVREIPLLRAKAARIDDHFGFDPLSHSGRMLQNTLESYPRDDLFQIDTDLLARYCEQIMELAERPRVRVLARIDHFDRFVSVIVYVPRENYNSVVREKISAYLARVYEGHISAYYPAFPEGGTARVHIIVGRRTEKTPRIPQAKLEEAIRAISTPWEERFSRLPAPAPCASKPPSPSRKPSRPKKRSGSSASGCLRRRRADPHPPLRAAGRRQADPLAEDLPRGRPSGPVSPRAPLENLGFQVVSERTFDLSLPDSAKRLVLHDMELALPAGRSVDVAKQGRLLEEAFLAAFSAKVDNDSFNRLVLLTGLSAREVTVIRAYARYLRQVGIVYSQEHIADTLTRYPDITRRIFALFQDGFNPALAERQREKKLTEHHGAIEEALSAVPNLDDDRTLRRYVNVIDATLRTNYFQTGEDGGPKPILAFKLDPHTWRPARAPALPGNLRLRHRSRGRAFALRQGGARRPALVGSRRGLPDGGAGSRQGTAGEERRDRAGWREGRLFPEEAPSPAQRDAFFNAGKEAYKAFIRTLLSITDNIVAGEVAGPADTLRIDGDDPYFVVAADKGTATFSDTANGLAQEAGFWLDDAFASGGSAGYDHKKMGITARGAWEAVKRHFREMNVDIQTTPFTVAAWVTCPATSSATVCCCRARSA